MDQEFVKSESVKSILLDSSYREFDKSGLVTFARKMKHEKSVSFEISGNLVLEFDKFGRTTFSERNGMWYLRYYNEPTKISKEAVPYSIIHKYWGIYNNL